jgi:hypothetical protein
MRGRSQLLDHDRNAYGKPGKQSDSGQSSKPIAELLQRTIQLSSLESRAHEEPVIVAVVHQEDGLFFFHYRLSR